MASSYLMYTLPQIQSSINDWWQYIVRQLNSHEINYDQALINKEIDLYRHWLDPELFFSQTCGYPLTTVLTNRVKLIGTPVYNSNYSQQANYCSLFLVRSTDDCDSIEDYAGKKFTFNGIDSQSGFNAVKTYLIEQQLNVPFFGDNIESGKHLNSIAKVAEGEADICAVDCVTYSLIQRHLPQLLHSVRVLTTTKFTPGLPFITSVNTSDEVIQAIYDAIQHACKDDSLCKVNSDLLIKGISKISLETYMQSIITTSTPKIDKL